MNDIKDGIDSFKEVNSIKLEMDKMYQERSKRKLDKRRAKEIDDQVYDIHKLQNQRKFENQRKINEINIGGNIYSGTERVISAIEAKMREELLSHSDIIFTAPPSQEEEKFLPKLDISEEESIELLGPIKESEITHILQYEVDLDSAPGEDNL